MDVTTSIAYKPLIVYIGGKETIFLATDYLSNKGRIIRKQMIIIQSWVNSRHKYQV